MNVLVAEDEPKVRRFIERALREGGIDVEATDDPSEIDAFLQKGVFDVLVLDRIMNGRDALSLVPQIRQKFPRLRILILSALGEVDERVGGLTLGADDYLAKPFHVTELLARVLSLGRRETAPTDSSELHFGGLTLFLKKQEVRFADRQISLTAKEFRVLALLMEHPDRLFSRTELLDRIWGMNFDPGSNVVDVTIRRLRSKLEEAGAPAVIQTRRGSGYSLGHDAE